MREKLAIVASMIILTGLALSKFLISIGIFFLLITALSDIHNLKIFSKNIYKYKAELASSGIFFLILLSGFNSENKSSLMGMLRVMLPFILIPLSLAILKLKSRSRYLILYFFCVLMFVTSVAVIFNYYLHYEHYQYQLSISKAIDTPQNDHIRYSLLIVFSIFSLFEIHRKKIYLKYFQTELWLQRFGIVFLIFSLHVLAVRSGLLAFYLAILIYVLHIFISQKRYLLTFVSTVVIICLPLLAFYTVPSIQQKYYLMKYNWEQYKKGKIGELSDTQRLLSYEIALKIAKKNPIFGVGIGDLRGEQEKIYKSEYPNLGVMQPHNQFLSILTSTGIVGFLSFLFFLFFPLFHKRNFKNVLLSVFYLILISSFMTENTIFISTGVTMYSFFIFLLINFPKKEVLN